MTDSNKGLILSDTLVPDIFMLRYMPVLKKDSISLYLWALMTFKNGEFGLKDAISYGAIPEDDIKNSLADLVANGLIVRNGNEKFSFIDLKRVEVDDYIKHGVDSDGEPVFRSEEKARNMLANSINKTYYLGTMQHNFYRLIDICLFDYKFENEVVYSLFDEGRALRIHYVIPKMYELAKNWYEKGYTTKDSLKDYYAYKDKRDGNIKLMGRLFRHQLNELELEAIERMTRDYGATPEVLEYAFNKLYSYKDKFNMKMVEDKVKEWYAAGVTTIDKIVVYEEERKQENKAKYSKRRGRTNTRRTGKEAGITLEDTNNELSDAKEGVAEEPKSSSGEDDFSDPVLDMFSGDDI